MNDPSPNIQQFLQPTLTSRLRKPPLSVSTYESVGDSLVAEYVFLLDNNVPMKNKDSVTSVKMVRLKDATGKTFYLKGFYKTACKLDSFLLDNCPRLQKGKFFISLKGCLTIGENQTNYVSSVNADEQKTFLRLNHSTRLRIVDGNDLSSIPEALQVITDFPRKLFSDLTNMSFNAMFALHVEADDEFYDSDNKKYYYTIYDGQNRADLHTKTSIATEHPFLLARFTYRFGKSQYPHCKLLIVEMNPVSEILFVNEPVTLKTNDNNILIDIPDDGERIQQNLTIQSTVQNSQQ